MDKRISVFNKKFSHWQIALPDDIENRTKHGQIVEAGWTVKFLFGEDCHGKFLDYYSAHRMTNDSHVRIRSDGTVEVLPALMEIRWVHEDPEEDARLEREWYKKNREIMTALEQKGFGLTGSEHPSFLINTHLSTHKVDLDSEDSTIDNE
ncbi:MAG: hypothetical protein F4X44_08100 [Gammaproteobacteria bacterium]|nr:hypothetical protein [Gammaproteobacteria bacterium]MYD80559.1 hypothetical protein [Gammaproteobacteria bacterium]